MSKFSVKIQITDEISRLPGFDRHGIMTWVYEKKKDHVSFFHLPPTFLSKFTRV